MPYNNDFDNDSSYVFANFLFPIFIAYDMIEEQNQRRPPAAPGLFEYILGEAKPAPQMKPKAPSHDKSTERTRQLQRLMSNQEQQRDRGKERER